MAAGRQNYSRKRYLNHPEEGTLSYRDVYDQRNVHSCFDDHNTRDTVDSDGRVYAHRKNGHDDDGRECRKKYAGRSLQSFDYEQDRKKSEAVTGDGSRLGSTKKRRFSPILWDRVDKQLRVSSKNRILSTNRDLKRALPQKSAEVFGRLQDIVGDVRIKRCSVASYSELEISPVESLVSNVSDGVGTSNFLGTSVPEEGDQEMHIEDTEYAEDQEYVELPNLSKSKWAFKDSPRMASDINYSSPESGEFKRGGSEGSVEGSSLSEEAGLPVAATSDDEQHENIDNKVANGSSGYTSSDGDNDGRHIPNAAEAAVSSGLSMMPCCRNVFEYERLGKISEGTYGVVYKARDKKTGDIVALKKVKMGKEREGFPVTALREINILGSFQHPSVVEVKEVVVDEFDGVYMVMEYVDHELKGYMERMKQPFSQSEVKRLMIQLLQGLSYLHDNWVIHRDLKTSNLLLTSNGELKICDFGMARQYGSPIKPYTSLVVTLWYRAPEVLLGMKNYTTAIDMWSVGCIMAELLSKKPPFDGNKELEQINKIFQTLGTPNESLWPGYSKLPGVKPNFVKQPYNTLRKRFPVATFTGSAFLTELGFDLMSKLLTYDPNKRITAEEALDHGWFRESPLPAEHVRVCK